MDDDIGVPNCPRCLLPMALEGTEARPYWRCGECGLTLL